MERMRGAMSESWAEFFAMGGFASYVWPAYGAFAAILGGLILHGVRRNRAIRRELDAVEARRRSQR